jgi:hypothetical protein
MEPFLSMDQGTVPTSVLSECPYLFDSSPIPDVVVSQSVGDWLAANSDWSEGVQYTVV